MMPADVFAEIVAALAAGLAGAASQRAIGDDAVADLASGHAGADRDDLAGRLDADDERQLALGEGHAAPAPDVDMIEPDRLDARSALRPAPGAGGAGDIEQFDLAVGDERQRAHASAPTPARRLRSSQRCGHAGSRVTTRQTFWPPKPNELEMARLILASRATFGTTSSGIVGSGTS